MTATAVDVAPPTEYKSPGLGCAGCGACCEEIHLNEGDRLRLVAWAAAIAAGMPDPADDMAWADYWLAGRMSYEVDGQTVEQRWIDAERPAACSTYGNAIWLASGKWEALPSGVPAGGPAALARTVMGTNYRCTVYDAVHRRCGDHEHRPPICRLAPWYEVDPAAGHVLPYPDAVPDFVTGAPLGCSYQLDAPPAMRGGQRPLIPLEVLSR